MKSFLVLFFAAVALTAQSVSGQTRNYLLASYDETIQMKEYYDEEIEYHSYLLTIEAGDMGYYFTDIIAQAADFATTEAQAAGIQYCADISHYLSRSNILYMERYILEAERASIRLHQTVLNQLRTLNIKEYDLELFYYLHSYVMQEAYNDLWYNHVYNMSNAWWNVYLEFFWNYEELYDCLLNALEITKKL